MYYEEKTIDGFLCFKTTPSGKWERVSLESLTLRERGNQLEIKRKDQLLAEALEQLLACEWFVSLAVIVAIQKELGIEED